MEALAAITEVVAWVAFPAAAVFGIVALVLRFARGAWASAPAVVADDELRWFSDDGALHSMPAEGEPDDDDLTVHYRVGRPHRGYTEPVAHDERAAGVTTGVLAGVAVVATVVSTVASMV